MIETPFLGDQYNYLLPGAILLFSLCFILLSFFNFESRVVSSLRRYNDSLDNIEESQSSSDTPVESTRDDSSNEEFASESDEVDTKFSRKVDAKASDK